MPLISCPECSEKVSDKALRCPKCGVQIRVPKRGVIGKLIKWSFIGFNILMVWSLFSYLGSVGEITGDASSSAERAGAAIGATIGIGMLLSIWGFGDVILGLFVLFTRPKS